jgi:hypothetical protein
MPQEHPLMPHATAAWLVDNSSLTFEQIATFCGLHVLEVQAIADETAQARHIPRDPIRAGDLTQEELERGQADPAHRLVLQKGPEQMRRTKGPRYTPVSKRQDKPDGIAWIVKNHPEITDAQISRLIGTTKNTISAIRDKTHWNMQNITEKDPVTLGLCSQRELDALVAAAAKKAGIEKVDATLEKDRDELLEELRAERVAAEKAAQDALAGESSPAPAEAPFLDPFAKR